MIKELVKKFLEYAYPEILYVNKMFSQDGEDALVAAYYEGNKSYKGFYVDVGAHHPFRFSNTAHFYRKGWNGINIEPTPSLFTAFERHRKRDINLNLGVSSVKSLLRFYEFDEPALNSFDEELSMERVKNTSYKITNEREIEVNTLENILSNYLPEGKSIDFMTIDVEGLDLEVLKSNDWSKYRPKHLLVEGEFDALNLADNAIYSFVISKKYDLVGRTKRTFLFQDILN